MIIKLLRVVLFLNLTLVAQTTIAGPKETQGKQVQTQNKDSEKTPEDTSREPLKALEQLIFKLKITSPDGKISELSFSEQGFSPFKEICGNSDAQQPCMLSSKTFQRQGVHFAFIEKNPGLLKYYLDQDLSLTNKEYIDLLHQAMADGLPNCMGQVVLDHLNQTHPKLDLYEDYFSKSQPDFITNSMVNSNQILPKGMQIAVEKGKEFKLSGKLPYVLVKSPQEFSKHVKKTQGKSAVFYYKQGHWTLVAVDRKNSDCRIAIFDSTDTVLRPSEADLSLNGLHCQYSVVRDLPHRQKDEYSCSAFAKHDYNCLTQLISDDRWNENFNSIMNGNCKQGLLAPFMQVTQSMSKIAEFEQAADLAVQGTKMAESAVNPRWRDQVDQMIDLNANKKEYRSYVARHCSDDLKSRKVNIAVRDIFKKMTVNVVETLLIEEYPDKSIAEDAKVNPILLEEYFTTDPTEASLLEDAKVKSVRIEEYFKTKPTGNF